MKKFSVTIIGKFEEDLIDNFDDIVIKGESGLVLLFKEDEEKGHPIVKRYAIPFDAIFEMTIVPYEDNKS